ncbi:MAG: HEPN domain-containing protein [Acidimicrobiia bacterium]|nr:HEPN domain-containing protein [bacterium]MXX63966.1 HEPN domain-containing protein [Acidimicrobiia bacterium]MCY3580579.1 HEPN domain-containing protein [bacterium]MCY3651837.1 HEPN domain-containing protein [bacterium]MDE0642718.1 HEPN domain-containing protein [bacterium]
MTYLDEVRACLQRAEDELQNARDIYGQGLYRIAVSVSYRSVFAAAKAVLAFYQDGTKTHRGLRERFGLYTVAQSDFPPHIARYIKRTERYRLLADYDMSRPSGDWEEEEAAEAIGAAEEFLSEVQAWFKRHHPEHFA